MKQKIRLTESELNGLIQESVKRVLREVYEENVKQTKYSLPPSLLHFLHSREKAHGSLSCCLNCYIEGKGWYNTMITNVSNIIPYIQRAEYWEITTGWNSSEPENLVAWGSDDGVDFGWNAFLKKPKWAKEGVHWNKPSERMVQLVLSKKVD